VSNFKKLVPSGPTTNVYRPTTDFMTWIKICGTTNVEDAMTAVDAGADALGFVFYEKSPRNVDPETVRDIVRELPPEIEKVGVLVNESFDQSSEIAEYCGLTALQLYEPLDHRASIETKTARRIFIAVRGSSLIEDPNRLTARGNWREFVDAVFIDSGNGQTPGGTGTPFDWKAAAPLVQTISKDVNVVIAGGLNPDNVSDAIRILNPWGVDVVSGVEASPGKKDPEKVRAFITVVRESEKSTK
jgi:phosphoribosylanthranilate isomerase